jgi:DNA-binding NarL/FixJ family response regulator
MTRVRVVLVDDHGLVRAGLRSLLESLPDVDVVGEAADGATALTTIESAKPDVVLMDISMPGLDGLEATRRAAKMDPRPRILVLSMHDERAYVREALAAGADGYLVKAAEREELALALAALARGQAWLSPPAAKVLIEELLDRPMRSEGPVATQDLTPRQLEVLKLIAAGQSTKQIARRLGLSVKTIETHRGQIMARLDIRHVAGLVRYALRMGLVADDN